MKLPLTLLAALSLCPMTSLLSVEPSAEGPRKVTSVEQVTVRTMESSPEQLQIEANGTVPTGGWTKPELRPSQEKGSNGTLVLEFFAQPPEGMATQVLSPVTATYTTAKPKDYKGVKVVAQTNSKEAK